MPRVHYTTFEVIRYMQPSVYTALRFCLVIRSLEVIVVFTLHDCSVTVVIHYQITHPKCDTGRMCSKQSRFNSHDWQRQNKEEIVGICVTGRIRMRGQQGIFLY